MRKKLDIFSWISCIRELKKTFMRIISFWRKSRQTSISLPNHFSTLLLLSVCIFFHPELFDGEKISQIIGENWLNCHLEYIIIMILQSHAPFVVCFSRKWKMQARHVQKNEKLWLIGKEGDHITFLRLGFFKKVI